MAVNKNVALANQKVVVPSLLEALTIRKELKQQSIAYAGTINTVRLQEVEFVNDKGKTVTFKKFVLGCDFKINNEIHDNIKADWSVEFAKHYGEQLGLKSLKDLIGRDIMGYLKVVRTDNDRTLVKANYIEVVDNDGNGVKSTFKNDDESEYLI